MYEKRVRFKKIDRETFKLEVDRIKTFIAEKNDQLVRPYFLFPETILNTERSPLRYEFTQFDAIERSNYDNIAVLISSQGVFEKQTKPHAILYHTVQIPNTYHLDIKNLTSDDKELFHMHFDQYKEIKEKKSLRERLLRY